MNNPKVSVVLGTYNRLPFLKLTIESVRNEIGDLVHEIIIIDGGSTDGTIPYLEQQKDIITIIQHNRSEIDGKPVARESWGHFMNLGFRRAQSDFICMISDDCLVVPGAIKNGLDMFEKEIALGKRIGAVAFYFRNWPDEKKYKVLETYNNIIYVNHGLYLKKALEEIGYIDENNYAFYCADMDICLKLKEKKYDCIVSPSSYIEHYNHANRNLRKENSTRYINDVDHLSKKWDKIFQNKESMNNTRKKEFYDKSKTAERFATISSVRFQNSLYFRVYLCCVSIYRRISNITAKKILEKTRKKLGL